MIFGRDRCAVIGTTTAPTISSAAERMRRYRQRRRDGLRCLNIQLRETEIDTLIRKGLLKPEPRNDANAIIEAFYRFLDRALGGQS